MPSALKPPARAKKKIIPARRSPKPSHGPAGGPTTPEAAAADPSKTIESLRARAAGCQACALYLRGTQTVFGEGSPDARFVLVGEQPGDREDVTGRPFVGPAGGLLDRALADAGIDRGRTYVTNAVKHFKWVREGKRRIHQKPSSREIAACRPWLEAELALLQPDVVIALGATAAQSLMGRGFRVTAHRGERFSVPWAKAFFATVHPSSILRAPSERRAQEYGRLVRDLKRAAR